MSNCIEHNKVGYDKGYLRMSYGGTTENAHRVAYCFARGIPLAYIKGSVIRHTCDNARCINPRHLTVGTHQDNSDDRVKRGRSLKRSNNPSAVLTEEDVATIRKIHRKGCRQFGSRPLGRMFNVSKTTIHYIVTNKLWV